MKKKILVTGGAGFLGSHLCDKLLESGHDIICADNLFTGSKENILHLMDNPYFEFLRHDITFPLFVEVDEENTDFFRENFDIEVIKFWNETAGGNNAAGVPQTILHEKRLFFKRDDEELLPHHVEYYFDLLVDEEIDSVFYCEAENRVRQKTKDVFADQNIPFNYPDKKQISSENIYEVTVTDQDFKDPC